MTILNFELIILNYMKKTYLQPETEILYLRNMEMIALSLKDEPATGDDALVKGDNNWNIWDNSEEED